MTIDTARRARHLYQITANEGRQPYDRDNLWHCWACIERAQARRRDLHIHLAGSGGSPCQICGRIPDYENPAFPFAYVRRIDEMRRLARIKMTPRYILRRPLLGNISTPESE